MIPKVIHQMWIGSKKMPIEWINTWKELNPEWKHVLWTEENLKDFKFENQSIIDKCVNYHSKKDVMQYEIMRTHGGFFIDADAICTRSLPDYLTRFEGFTCYESEVKRPGYLALGYIAAKPGHKVFDDIIKDLKTLTVYEPAWKFIGQLMWTKWADKYKDIVKLPSTFFIPKHFEGGFQNGSEEASYAKQFWGTTLSLYKDK